MMMMTFIYERRNKAKTWDQQGLVPRAVTHIEKMKKSYGKYDIAEVRPPPVIRPTGRPRKQRRKDADKLNGNGGERKCVKCGMFGHNKKTCKGSPTLPQPPIRRPISRKDTPVSQRELRANMGFNITNDEPMGTRDRSGRSSIREGGRSGGRGSGRSCVGTGGRSSAAPGGRSSAAAGSRSSAAPGGRSSAVVGGRSSAALGSRSSAVAGGRSSAGGRLSATASGRSSVATGGRSSVAAGGRSSVAPGGRSRGRSSNSQSRGRGSYNAYIGEWFKCSQGSGPRSTIDSQRSQTNQSKTVEPDTCYTPRK
ncbi:hypothetical protein GIB67_008265 [Kingdonia uniflora]|uniref:CCHC-type domain-containing protein n=1 Tax=Kingdonia uniflora TaxID=39325 RepID=A0A7J7N4T2_9MAGN|nr:hypothetical protein GIB67_008265 [Kingdonia uniflora]